MRFILTVLAVIGLAAPALAEDDAAMIAEGESGGAFADEIVAARYSGRYATAAGPAAFNLPDALLWRALDFTKPPGRCGGSTGYWSEEPKL